MARFTPFTEAMEMRSARGVTQKREAGVGRVRGAVNARALSLARKAVDLCNCRRRLLSRELCMKRPARHRSSPMELALRLNPQAQHHCEAFSKHGLSPLALRAHREPAMADKSTNSAKRITMSVAPCERTTAGRGCLLGRGPAVRIADPPRRRTTRSIPREAMPQGQPLWPVRPKLY